MKSGSIRKCILPPGPILSLILIGLLLLSAIVYYRAVKIQRFLEPALAISQPKIKFAQNIRNTIVREFGTSEVPGLKFRAGSIFLDPSLLSGDPNHRSYPVQLSRLSRVFLSALEGKETREHISLIMVGIRFRQLADPDASRIMSLKTQQRAWLLLNALFAAEPRLEREFGTYFVAAAIPVGPGVKEDNLIEFRIIPTERLHIEVLQRFEKYMR